MKKINLFITLMLSFTVSSQLIFAKDTSNTESDQTNIKKTGNKSDFIKQYCEQNLNTSMLNITEA